MEPHRLQNTLKDTVNNAKTEHPEQQHRHRRDDDNADDDADDGDGDDLGSMVPSCKHHTHRLLTGNQDHKATCTCRRGLGQNSSGHCRLTNVDAGGLSGWVNGGSGPVTTLTPS